MAGNGWKWLELLEWLNMSKKCQEWLEMYRNGWELLEQLEMTLMGENDCNLMELLGMAGNEWKFWK